MDFGLSALLTTGSGFEVGTFLASTSIARELGAIRLSAVPTCPRCPIPVILTRFVSKPIGCLLDRLIDATISLSGARVGEYISPPILACSLLWMRPRPPGHCLTRCSNGRIVIRRVLSSCP
jgi:hypothetical protein